VEKAVLKGTAFFVVSFYAGNRIILFKY
ncbi:uncharacterized protein METZ01_LOCUS116343, partial [marine metagenome]